MKVEELRYYDRGEAMGSKFFTIANHSVPSGTSVTDVAKDRDARGTLKYAIDYKGTQELKILSKGDDATVYVNGAKHRIQANGGALDTKIADLGVVIDMTANDQYKITVIGPLGE